MDNFEEDNIRNPDETVNDQLLEDTRSDFEKQIDEAIYISTQEIKQNHILNTQYEEQLLKDYAEETNRRKDFFKDFLFNINKIGKFDNEVREIYDIIEPIIESYCNQSIKSCELDETTYNKIFSTLKKIRNNPLTLETLKTIILSE
jgi:hypothetical protein